MSVNFRPSNWWGSLDRWQQWAVLVPVVVLIYLLPVLNPPLLTTEPGTNFQITLFNAARIALIAIGLNIVVGQARLVLRRVGDRRDAGERLDLVRDALGELLLLVTWHVGRVHHGGHVEPRLVPGHAVPVARLRSRRDARHRGVRPDPRGADLAVAR